MKASQAGTLILSSSSSIPPGAARITIVPNRELPPPPPDGEAPGQAPLPRAYTLEQNYPNPFNPATVIRYSLPARGRVVLKVYDMLGREVKTLIDEIQDAGSRSTSWDADGMPSGIYFCRLTAGEFTETKKMVLMK